ncbi:MAG: exo-alpha-sialidase [Bacteroidetes bacterium]|nr:exo-alpha-sialidase [Bacteroidota bacterium]
MKWTYIGIVTLLLGTTSCSRSKQQISSNFKVEELVVPSGNSSAEPFLFSDSNTVYLSWIEKNDSGTAFKMSRLENSKWSEPATIATGNTWFVNWADYPMLASKGQNMIAHFLDKSSKGKYAYDVKLTFSDNGGESWRTPGVLNDDGKEAEHGFVTLLPYKENFFVTWLDGRNTAMEGIEGMDHHEGHHGAMSLRAAIIDYSGKNIKEWELDNKTCDCCQTSAAITPEGPVVVYRDRSDDEIRDMSIVRLVNGEWTTPKAIHNDNWKIAGCPVNGPRATSKGNTLAIAWFSAATDTARVDVIFSNDGGESFGQPIRIDEGNAIGRVDIDVIDENTALVTWMEGGEIKLAKVTSAGLKEPSVTLANSSDARTSGFPQLTIAGGRAIAAWTDDKEKTIKTVSINL